MKTLKSAPLSDPLAHYRENLIIIILSFWASFAWMFRPSSDQLCARNSVNRLPMRLWGRASTRPDKYPTIYLMVIKRHNQTSETVKTTHVHINRSSLNQSRSSMICSCEPIRWWSRGKQLNLHSFIDKLHSHPPSYRGGGESRGKSHKVIRWQRERNISRI